MVGTGQISLSSIVSPPQDPPGGAVYSGSALGWQHTACLEPVERRSDGMERTEDDDSVERSCGPQRLRACRGDVGACEQPAPRALAQAQPPMPHRWCHARPCVEANHHASMQSRSCAATPGASLSARIPHTASVLAALGSPAQILRKLSRGIGIVGDIQDPRRPRAVARRAAIRRRARIDHLKASDQPCGGQSARNRRCRHAETGDRVPPGRRWRSRRCGTGCRRAARATAGPAGPSAFRGSSSGSSVACSCIRLQDA